MTTNNKNTPPHQPSFSNRLEGSKKVRNSNLELFRIISMLMIVAHHYVLNSGLASDGGPLLTTPQSANSLYLALFGAWGKTGINCFLMITGYFMCTSKITVRKFLKLMLQIYLYSWLSYAILTISGYDTLSIIEVVKRLLPVWGLEKNFSSCFIVFWLTIPFWATLVQNLSQRQHQLLLLLLISIYTIFGSIPNFEITFNYATWFGIIFLMASYIRLYPISLFDNKKLWGWITLAILLISMGSIVGMQCLFGSNRTNLVSYFFVSDSNKIFAVALAVSSFLWFKNMKIKYSKVINAFGAGTFGVLLIHANSDAMRIWLWKKTVDCLGHYNLPLNSLILYTVFVVLAIFVICNLIDQLRIATLEKWFFKWYDYKYADKAEAFVSRLIND